MLNADFSDFIDYFSEDENTDRIAIYMEAIPENRGKDFIESCKKCKKEIVVLKAGKSSEGQNAAKSHTAALASEQGIYEGVFKQCKIKEVDSVSELFGLLIEKKKIKIANRACIITNAGGLGVLTADYCYKAGIKVAKTPDSVVEKLDKIFNYGNKNNPIDVVGDARAERFEKVLNVLVKENFYDFFIVLLTPQYMTEPEKTAEIISKIEKPVVACFMGGKSIESALKILNSSNVQVIKDPVEIIS